mmetsp:Transcript_51137/g.109540  ORF Transcript_51137/g.109540 Transcript_51137/m.109540 type:complete len:215 (-) Transcript_51137:136-780(-)
MSASMIFGSYFPACGLLTADDSLYKYVLMHHYHPTDRFLSDAQEDWDRWQKIFRDQGDTHEYIPYPYDKSMIKSWCDDYSFRMGWPIDINGPPEQAKTDVMDSYERNVRSLEGHLMSSVVRLSKLHQGCKDDPYAAVAAGKDHGPRSKLTGSDPSSALDFDVEAFDQWKSWTTEKCKIADIETDSKSIMNQEDTWQSIYDKADGVKGVFKKAPK